MSEHDADKNPEPEHETAVKVEQPKAPAGGDGKLAGLMAEGDTSANAAKAGKAPARDLEAEALRAAEDAIAEGERALATARAQLETRAPAAPTKHKRGGGRELALRLMLAVNVVAMVVVASLPSPSGGQQTPPPAVEHQPAPQLTAREYNEPFNRALAAADRRDFGSAVATLEQYLQDNPRMAPSRRLTVLTALSEYTARLGNFARSQDYVRQANAIEQSHKTPEDLVADAKAAIENGDQEGLRSIWARFLLQQRQVPSWLYKHVAQAYLELGDSYRRDADAAAEIARRKELEEAATRLRNETIEQQEHR
ncbi:MAG: hypothetical protein H6835_08965 [Planctomycetes bacterium]|nr:hypothetical protein [Planctomycetota bacterium]